jgi:osmoprotectant transport system substrate-binding protein
VRPSRVRSLLLLAAGFALATSLTACTGRNEGSAAELSAGTIRVAAYDFAENQILAAVYAAGIRRAGLPVAVQTGVGTREVVEPALEQGVVDVVVDYLGTALDFVAPGRPAGPATADQLHAALLATLGPRGVSVLGFASAEDQNGFAVSTAFAAAHSLRRLSDLVPLAAGLTFGGPPECRERPLCLPGLQDVYGLQFGTVQPVSSRSATVEELVAGEIDVGLLETTDARLGSAPVVLLADDRALQPHENVVPLVRTAVLEARGDPLRAALDDVTARLTTDVLVGLNRAVEVEGLTPAEAADRWFAHQ